MDRNWDELMQELRVTQTGAQILVGFLLTVPFQQRFAQLDHYQRSVYLVLVALAVLATVLIVTPVSLHRLLFRRRMKRELVKAGSVFALAGLGVLAVVLTGVPLLLFDVVVSRHAGWVAAAVVAVLLAVCWWTVPRLMGRGAPPSQPPR
ncbi:MAG: sodium:proton antiporter [Cellulomonas sp. 14-74-6]|jgi:predicted neutral ceramidase superfamily lipid hydrolase|nr:MAG: sodium:proton antiporter [Cellulomonas sp. 14-74-6]